MPAFIYYAREAESASFIEAMLSEYHFTIIPNTNFDRPSPYYVDIVSKEFEQYRRVNRKFYAHGDFTIRPPFMQPVVEEHEKGTYEIDNTRFGPLIEISCPVEKSVVGRYLGFVFGEIYCPPSFWNDESQCKNKVTESAVRAYKLMARGAKKKLIKLDNPERVWMSPEALKLFEGGKARLLFKGAWVDRNGDRVPIYQRGAK